MISNLSEDKTHVPTNLFIKWLRAEAAKNGGTLPRFSNAEAADVMGLSVSRDGRHRGKIHSRIDFACYRCNLPPIGLGADEPFKRAWHSEDAGWAYPVEHMAFAVKARSWSEIDFDSLQLTLDTLRPDATKLWRDEIASSSEHIKSWAYGFVDIDESPERSERKKNTNWTRDELILALHLYKQPGGSVLSKNSVEVAKLSRLLNQLSRSVSKNQTYRNVNGVYMKLMNFRSIDPKYTSQGKVGLTRNNKDEQVVWDLFADDVQRLNDVVANLITTASFGPEKTGADDPDEDDIQDCEEGRILTRQHRYRERDRTLVEKFKAQFKRKNNGLLFCAGCHLDFARNYGSMSDRLIDVHHTKPVHTMLPGDKTSPNDLILLCVCCHRIVHSTKKWLELDELRNFLANTKGRSAVQ